METLTVKEYKRLKAKYDDGDDSAGQILNYRFSVYSDVTDCMEDDEILVYGETIHPENRYHLLSGWIPLDMIEECSLEIDLTETSDYHHWTSEITKELYSKTFESEIELKEAIENFYIEFERKGKIFLSRENIIFDYKIDHLDRKKFYIIDSGIELNY